ncbi:hypothetical protein SAMN04488554_2844 [Ruania alba]|uniref:Uncharacterized protein n=1 Tax=Ruania alba TaxID=648782 RepID=A0A1H5LL67_9MICO|nr:hypothetical protein SAMN04488554_2844 [Ruania alba]
MGEVAADSLYETAFVPSWDASGPIGHVVVRRLDDRATVAEIAVNDEDAPRAALTRAEHELRGPSVTFE